MAQPEPARISPLHRTLEGERRFIMHGVPWATYALLRDSLDDGHSGLRLTYLEGSLELMSPSGDHEDLKTLIARLLEAWAEERDVELNGRGSQTFRREAKLRGLEPDECYSIGTFADVPEIAIEVVISRGLLDKLAVYAGLGVAEVWVWQESALTVWKLAGDRYRRRTRSGLLPGLDLEHLAGFVRPRVQQNEHGQGLPRLAARATQALTDR